MVAERDLDSTLGALFLSNIFGALLYGLVCVQVYQYFKNSSRIEDSLWLKIIIMVIWALDTVNLSFATQATYFYAVTNFGDPKFSTPTLGIAIHPFVTELLDCLCRGIFTWRIWRLAKNKWMVIVVFIVAILSLFSLGVGCYLTYLGARFFAPFSSFHTLGAVIYTAFASSAVADVTICVALCVALHASRTGIQRTDSLMNTLMVYGIQTGALTCAALFTFIITFATMPNSLVWEAICLILSRLYFNALMANLNARDSLRRQDTSLACITSASSKAHVQFARSISQSGPMTATVDSVIEQKEDGLEIVEFRLHSDVESFSV